MPANATRDVETLQREISEARADMAEAIEQLELTLRQRLDLRRQLLSHPLATLALVAVGGLGVALTIGHFLQNRRIRRALEQLPRARRWHFGS